MLAMKLNLKITCISLTCIFFSCFAATEEWERVFVLDIEDSAHTYEPPVASKNNFAATAEWGRVFAFDDMVPNSNNAVSD
jgi:hypothetical protein